MVHTYTIYIHTNVQMILSNLEGQYDEGLSGEAVVLSKA